MNVIPTFSDDANCVIVGASGGIGAALASALGNDERVAKVHGLSRSANGVETIRTDITDEDSVEAAAAAIGDDPLDLVIVATGVLHRESEFTPEKSIRELDPVAMRKLFEINTVGPALVAKHLLPRMRRGHKTVFAAISARVGSIADNRLGGWVSYRASKAALNMVLKTFSVEQARRRPECAVIGLHPGTVDTALSRPFQRNVPDGKLFTADQSARYLLDVVDGITAADTGGVFAWDGSRIEY